MNDQKWKRWTHFSPQTESFKTNFKKGFLFWDFTKMSEHYSVTFLNTDIWIKSYRGLKHPPASAGTCIQALVGKRKPHTAKDTTPMCHHWHCSEDHPGELGKLVCSKKTSTLFLENKSNLYFKGPTKSVKYNSFFFF